MDGYATVASVFTGIIILVAVLRHKWFEQIDEERDAQSIGFILVALTLIAVVAVITVGILGPHFS